MNDPVPFDPASLQTSTSRLDPPPLRLWPAFLAVLLMLAVTFGTGFVAPGTMLQFRGMVWGPMIGGVLLALWWVFFSRAAWIDRIGVLLVFAIAAAFTRYFAHKSIQPLGLMIYGLPAATTSFVVWLWIVKGRVSPTFQRWSTVAVLIAATCVWALVRCDGISGTLSSYLSWRWNPTSEQQFLASLSKEEPTAGNSADAAPLELAAGDWPGFRGAKRDNIVSGEHIETEWQSHPPKELWRRAIGPGWSSFCVVGHRVFTQEQRNAEEAVLCYDSESGKPLWKYSYPARFDEMISGLGPRGTPTFQDGKLYTMGARGVVNALDAATGKLLWTRDVTTDTQARLPEWGYASSPLVVGDLVVVFAGASPKDVIAYDRATGEPRWTAEAGHSSYSSPQLFEHPDGSQILMLSDQGIVSLSPTDGELVWEHAWPINNGPRVVQPNVTDAGEGAWSILLGTGYGHGTRLLTLTHEDNTWTAEEEWTSRDLKPYFNDLVVHDGCAYGFDGNMLACIDLKTGDRHWKQGRYGNGQVLLLADQGLLLVIAEQGELALVKANPEEFEELSRIQAVEGKTWNHPVVAHGKLYVRNAEEIVCFTLD